MGSCVPATFASLEEYHGQLPGSKTARGAAGIAGNECDGYVLLLGPVKHDCGFVVMLSPPSVEG